MFGVDWCPHCVSAKPEFESLGSTVTIGGHAVQLRVVNPEKDKAAAEGYDIQGFPTFYLDANGSRMKYQGPRTAAGFRAFLEKQLAA
jgi:thiol-disulfide isomerase/thioredoxin